MKKIVYILLALCALLLLLPFAGHSQSLSKQLTYTARKPNDSLYVRWTETVGLPDAGFTYAIYDRHFQDTARMQTFLRDKIREYDLRTSTLLTQWAQDTATLGSLKRATSSVATGTYITTVGHRSSTAPPPAPEQSAIIQPTKAKLKPKVKKKN